MERVVQRRLQRHLETEERYLDTMLGFREKLAAVDIMLQLKEDIIARTTPDTRIIVGLDVSKAFDNIKHSAILDKLCDLGVGERMYNYIRDFLTNRTATINIGGETMSDIAFGGVGTPQGSVISPTLFNMAMLGLPKILQEIEGLNHSLYADDLTLWTNKGSDGQVEQTLQKAIDEIERYLHPLGLKLSAEKSEFLIMRGKGRKAHTENPNNITIRVYGNIIKQVPNMRVLGLRVQDNGKNGETINKLDQHAVQVCRLLKRVGNKRAGMREKNLIRLIQAFVVSRIT